MAEKEKGMILAKIRVSGVRATVVCLHEIPKGITGGQVLFEYTGPMWDSLTKTVVFCGSGVTKDILNAGEVVEVPREVVERAGLSLMVGVYGTNAGDNLAIPTLWADLGKIRPAADPSGDESIDEGLPVWAQLQEQINDLKENGSGGGLVVDSDGEGNVTITAAGSTTITSDGAGNVTIG